MARSNLCNKFIQVSFAAGTFVASATQTAASFTDSGARFFTGTIVGAADAAVAYYYQGTELNEEQHTNELKNLVTDNTEKAKDKEGKKEGEIDPEAADGSKLSPARPSRQSKACTYTSQALVLGAITASTVFDRYFTLSATMSLAETLCLGSLSGYAFWTIYGVDLAIALLGKVILVDGYATTKELSAVKPFTACIVNSLKPGSGLKALALTEAVLAEDIIPLAILPASFADTTVCSATNTLKTALVASSVTAGALIPVMLTLSNLFDGKAVDNNLRHAQGKAETPLSIPLSSKCCVSSCRATLNAGSVVRGLGAGVPAGLAAKQLLLQTRFADKAHPIGAVVLSVVGLTTWLGNQFTEVKAAQKALTIADSGEITPESPLLAH